MNILVITGCCLLQNTSANLSHRAFIDGMIQLGHSVDLLSFSTENINVDEGIELPKVDNLYTYNGISLYERLATRKVGSSADAQKSNEIDSNTLETNKSLKNIVFDKVKKIVRSTYGIYNPSIVWYRNAKKFFSEKSYDVVVSMSYPQVSHLTAQYLIKKGNVKTKKWIQLWEDPWSTDLNNSDDYKKCFKAESKLLDSDADIVYVTPLTLKRQQELFSNNKNKMRWVPLPSYYQSELVDFGGKENCYGYFGDYSPEIRNIMPFYNVAVKKGIKVYICGSPYGIISNACNVKVYPRQPLDKLKIFEDNTNVLICLFNLGGGQIPGKIYQYAATNKHVIAILDGDESEKRIIKEYFSKFNRFIFCDNNEQSISEAIDNLEAGKYKDIKNIPLDAFSKEKAAERLIGR